MFSPFAFMGNNFQSPGPPVTGGLISLYNPAYEGGYNTGSNTIVDLWGSKDLQTAGTPVNVRDDGSIYFYTSSYASSSAELSVDLLGSGSEFTVLAYSYFHGSGSYIAGGVGAGRFKIGSPNRNNFSNVFTEIGIDTGGSNAFYPIGIGATSGSGFVNAAWDIYYPIMYEPNPFKFTNYGVPKPPTPPASSAYSGSFIAYSKADQNISYTKPNTNLSVYVDGFWANTLYQNIQKTTVGIYTNAAAPVNSLYVFDSADGSIPDILETYITQSYLVINPDYTNAPSGGNRANQEFALKGFAIYNRVLSTVEIQSMKTWFDESY
tara:strand:- start:397 stop:1359 length:963 start_codon:yes stop_codon:yes gene_type:complete